MLVGGSQTARGRRHETQSAAALALRRECPNAKVTSRYEAWWVTPTRVSLTIPVRSGSAQQVLPGELRDTGELLLALNTYLQVGVYRPTLTLSDGWNCSPLRAISMDHLPILLLIFLTLNSLWTSHLLPAPEQETTLTPTSHSVPSINRSGEKTVEQIKHALLRALNLRHIPGVQTEMVKELRSLWRERFPAISPNLRGMGGGQPAKNVTQPQGEVAVTGTNESSTPTTPSRCCRTTAQISLADLGWEHWIVYPEHITYVDCASCRHPRHALPAHCRSNLTSRSTQGHRRHCCKAVKIDWIPIVYVDEHLSLVISNIPLAKECGEEQ
ncbi:uncharacterized protein [Narcine bancroftii]|uniref:uncharacterized protein n=1 Tax=Narcine bancroftii TaxID=1343680 RepID=UPI00383228EC